MTIYTKDKLTLEKSESEIKQTLQEDVQIQSIYS